MATTPMKQELDALAAEAGKPLPKILMAASECAPLAKTGGLADVVGTLPKYLHRLGVDARVMIPYHRIIKDKYGDQAEYLFSYDITFGSQVKTVGVYRLIFEKICIWLIDNEEYFDGPIYIPYREGEQYAYFTRAVLETLLRLDYVPDIIHCNDWHTGMLPLLLKTQYVETKLSHTKTVLTIHNIAYQGLCGFGFVKDFLGIQDGSFGMMERYGQASFMKAGVVLADLVTTVSPAYAKEICTPEYGEGLERELSMRGDVCGIVNGIDKKVWTPTKDPDIPVQYSKSKMVGKVQCKTALLEEVGLEIVPNRPLIGMVTRLAEQKGIDLMIGAMDKLLWEEDFAFVLLGNGDAGYEDWFRGLQARHPGRVSACIGYSDPLSHRIYAGCDFYLMPSRFEPCGISQLIAMAYGTLPIVRETGGLKDTVVPFNRYTGEGTGFSFMHYDPDDMAGAIHYALDTYYNNKPAMKQLIKAGMSRDSSCERWALEYAKLYLAM